MLAEKLLGNYGSASDPNFANVSLLLHGDGTNGAQNNTFLDSSSNNFTITRNGNTTQGTFSPFSKEAGKWGVAFNSATPDWFTVADNTAFNLNGTSYTIEAWVNPSALSSYQTIISKRSATWELGTLGSNLYWYNGTVYSGTAAVNIGQWNHVAVTYDGVNTRLFVNGVLDRTIAGASAGSGASVVTLGSPSSGGQFWPGSISNLRVVKGSALYTSSFTPSTAPLTAVSGTSLLAFQDNRFKDNSSNNFTLTISSGAPKVTPDSPFSNSAAYSASVNGGSGYFDGTGGYLAVAAGTIGASTDFTMEFWFFPISSYNTNSYGLMAQADGRRGMILAGGNLYWLASSDINTGVPATVGVWNHVAISRSGTTLRVFKNGTQIATGSNSDAFTGNWRIGSDQGNEVVIPSYFSDVRLVVGTAIYTANFTPPTAPLTVVTNTSLLLNFTNAGIYDNTGKNDLETVGNAQISTSVKKFGTGSMYFDGNGDNLSAPNSAAFSFGTADFTAEGWFNGSALTTSPQGLFTTAGGLGVYAQSNGIQTAKVGTTGLGTYAASISNGTWYHFAVSRSGTSLKIFLNGTAIGSITDSTNFTSTGVACVGSENNQYYFNGYIDDLRITKGVARYTANFTVPSSAFPDK